MTTKNSVFSNLIWRFMERCGAQGVTLVVSIVLARLLDPDTYGTVALVTIFITIFNVFIDSGLSTALIQKKEADSLDFSSVFYFNLVVCIILYLVMFFCAPLIAMLYENPQITPIIRVLSITLLISGVKSIQQAYVSRTMQFKKFFFSTLGGTVSAAVIGIVMAYFGFGIWALVAQQILNNAIDTVILWFTVKWRPTGKFSLSRLKTLFSYGWKILLSTLLNTIYEDMRQFIIGKSYSSSDLAYFNQGKKFPQLIVNNINSSIDSVLLPKLSGEQDDCERICAMTRRAIKTSVYVMAPLMIILSVAAEPLVILLLTEKWLPCVPFLRIFCVTFIFYPIHTSNLNAIKAMGRSDLYLKLEIYKKIVGVLLLLGTMKLGVMAMAYSQLANSLLCQLINTWPNRKLLKYGYLDQIKDILPEILMAIFAGACAYFIIYLPISTLWTVLIQLFVGGFVYLLLSYIFKLDSFKYIKGIINGTIKKKKASRE